MFGHDDHDQDKDEQDEITKIDVAIGGATGSGPVSPSDNSTVSGPPPTTISPSEDSSSDTDTSSLNDNSPSNSDSGGSVSGSGDLLDIKKEALQKLSPLVGHLDQTPEEKFKTTMMMIQATDDQSLVKAAYDAANNIPDEKAKAQALLDVVNEINYFTQPKKD